MNDREAAILIEGILFGSSLETGTGAPSKSAREAADRLAQLWRVDPMLREGIAAALAEELERVLNITRLN
jgi:hypothetical protein